jgi:hypothetical protein
MASLLIFLFYHTFLVTPIMGYYERFLYPVWPILVYLTCKSWSVLMRLRGGPPQISRWIPASLIAGLSLWMLAFTWMHRPNNLQSTLGKMDMNTAYLQLGQNNWPFLPEFLYLGDSLKIASTELGILGAMAPRNTIYDLSGLHNLETARYGLDTDRLLREQHPDLIYMPHPDYVEMIASLRQDSSFRVHYLEFPADNLNSWLGIALWKESPFFLQMQHIVTTGKNVDVEIVP